MNGIDRKTFALYYFGSAIVFVGGTFGFAYLFPEANETISGCFPITLGMVCLIVWIGGIYQRLENLKQSQLLFLLLFVPLVNFAFIIYLLVMPTPADLEKSQSIAPDLGKQTKEACPNCTAARSETDIFCAMCGFRFEQ